MEAWAFFFLIINKPYLLTYSIVQSPSSEANWFPTSQEIPRISRNLSKCNVILQCEGKKDLHKSELELDNLSSCRDKWLASYFIRRLHTRTYVCVSITLYRHSLEPNWYNDDDDDDDDNNNNNN